MTPKQQTIQHIKTRIQYMRDNEQSDEFLRANLIMEGWPEELVDEAMRDE